MPNIMERPSTAKVFKNVDEASPVVNNFRDFREYAFLRPNDVLLTIEHCDKCEFHSSTTRHDPLKYATLA